MRGEGRRAGKSERLSVYYTEAWMAEQVEKALEIDGCRTDQEKSQRRGYYLALMAETIIRQQQPRSAPVDPYLSLQSLSPPDDEIAAELREERFADSAPLTVAVPELLTAEPREASRHKASVW